MSQEYNHQVKIRQRQEEDLSTCVAVLERVYATDGYPVQGTAHAEAFLSNESIGPAWVATVADRIVGHVAVGKAANSDVAVALWRQSHPEDPIAVLERLYVDPDHRGSGVAAQLIKAVMVWSAESDLRLVLFALEKDKPAMRLYERLHWTHFGTTTYRYGDGQTMDAWCYASPESTA
ncbi:Putative GNAT domain, acyl-CoA N-acyltransferase [Septoria linicola]|uniref:GNAT domain, acyl-CoA N-acyltransferase n=1 Tax=Septoria linicola TaxID=215465 RepID=A0A9Q9ENA0_9PEZI|nr:putative GNAT domain, acyl-CoA N-acyltransferase [Septoria linicola]USW55278.1 Putative GNAT domain, acyl-CoA N-acyltransferase [Septoria linicola]